MNIKYKDIHFYTFILFDEQILQYCCSYVSKTCLSLLFPNSERHIKQTSQHIYSQQIPNEMLTFIKTFHMAFVPWVQGLWLYTSDIWEVQFYIFS